MKKIILLYLVAATLGCNSNKSSTESVTSATQEAVKKNIDAEQLFKINCSQCHQPNQDFTGPALKGVVERWKDINLLHEFVKNSQSVIAKNEYAKSLFTKWNGTIMPPFSQLANEEIDAILDYCNHATE
ncbi:MAG: cytochrome c [Bacteroidetes bacterium]|nr:cytochrome c [Bacteroidota bacterium]MBS1757441.1 cytochrome c [Bacteroidota bacterium]